MAKEKEWIFEQEIQYAFFGTNNQKIEEDKLTMDKARDKVYATLENRLGFVLTKDPAVLVKKFQENEEGSVSFAVSTWTNNDWLGMLYLYGLNLTKKKFSNLVKAVREENKDYLMPLRYGRCP